MPWFLCRSLLILKWCKSSSWCPVDNYGQVTLRLGGGGRGIHNVLDAITSLSQDGIMCTTLAQCSLTFATSFNMFCVTYKKCA